MQIIPLGEQALLVNFEQRIDPEVNRQVIALHHRLMGLANAAIVSSTPAFCSLAIGYDPSEISYDDLVAVVEQQFGLIQTVADQARPVLRIPVCYSDSCGVDLDHVAQTTGLSRQQIIDLHTGKTYHAYMLGFLPGFAYLGSVDPSLRVERQSEPRLKVEAGSVGLAGEQTGIYPSTAPGGWQIIGRTPISLIGDTNSSQFLISPGDQVQFYSIEQAEFDLLLEQNKADDQPIKKNIDSQNRDSISLHFKTSGLRTTIQDFGRQGHQHYGIPSGGVMDRFSAYCANIAVGNRGDASLIEITLMGPVIEFSGDCQIAITGANLIPKLDGQPIPTWEPITVTGGQQLSFGSRQNGCRSYLAIAGEIRAPKWLDSVSPSPAGVNPATDQRSLNGETIIVSAWTRSNPQSKQPAKIFAASKLRPPQAGRPPCLIGQASGAFKMRVPIVRGPEWDWFSEAQRAALTTQPFQVLSNSNSMGYRLSSIVEGSSDVLGEPTEQQQSMISSAVVPGVIQVTPNGQAILLMRDAQTTGGYPRIGVVCFESLDEVAQLCPGDLVHFELSEAGV